MCLTNYCVRPSFHMLHDLDTELTEKLKASVCTPFLCIFSVLVPAKSTEIKLLPVSSVYHLMFYSEMSSLHYSDLYRACLNKWGFFPPSQCKDKDRRRRKLFAIWSINKNANSGKPFLSCDNGGVVTAAPKDSETDGPNPIPLPLEFFIFKLKRSD